jgi:excisionase family DNA binding protein
VRGRRSGSWERVEAARRQARVALGKDPDSADDYGGRPKPRLLVAQPPAPTPIVPGQGVRVLSLGEAAARLGVSRESLEAMVDAGKVQALPTGFTKMIPTSEVVRLGGGGSQR